MSQFRMHATHFLFPTAMCVKIRNSWIAICNRDYKERERQDKSQCSKGGKSITRRISQHYLFDAHRNSCDIQRTFSFGLRCASKSGLLNCDMQQKTIKQF
jgi:hypothetical protein